MAKYLLDTNHISPLVTPGHRLRSIFSEHYNNGDGFCIAAPALAEMLFGIQVLPRAEQNMQEWQELEPIFTYYQIEKQDAQDAASLQVLLRRQGWQLGTVDALIATVALRYDLILLSTDKDFQAVPELNRENWLSG